MNHSFFQNKLIFKKLSQIFLYFLVIVCTTKLPFKYKFKGNLLVNFFHKEILYLCKKQLFIEYVLKLQENEKPFINNNSVIISHEKDSNHKAADGSHAENTDWKIDHLGEIIEVEQESFVDGDESENGSQYESFIPVGKNIRIV